MDNKTISQDFFQIFDDFLIDSVAFKKWGREKSEILMSLNKFYIFRRQFWNTRTGVKLIKLLTIPKDTDIVTLHFRVKHLAMLNLNFLGDLSLFVVYLTAFYFWFLLSCNFFVSLSPFLYHSTIVSKKKRTCENYVREFHRKFFRVTYNA